MSDSVLDAYSLTLHADLVGTLLEDFIANEKGLIKGVASVGLLDGGEAHWFKVEPGWTPSDFKGKQVNWQLKKWDQNLEHTRDSGQVLIALSIVQRGATSCLWAGHYPGQGMNVASGRRQSGKSDFWLEATHYRRDQLNVVMWESPNIEPILGSYVKDWLKQYWRDAFIDLLASGVPSPPPPNRFRPSSYKDKDLLSTLVYYLLEHHGRNMQYWCDTLRDISRNTCTTHQKKGLILTTDAFEKRANESLAAAAQRVLRGDWAVE
jgi:hypothetical protein